MTSRRLKRNDSKRRSFRGVSPRRSQGAWQLHDVSSVREKALAMAADLLHAEKAIGVKVVKESYEGDYGRLSLAHDLRGRPRQAELDADDEDALPVLPCFKPEDLYSQHARTTLARLLRDFLTATRSRSPSSSIAPIA